MSYSEESNDVVLRMSRKDYDALMMNLGAMGIYSYEPHKLHELLDRLNSGNPNYTPYQVGELPAPPVPAQTTKKEED